MLDKLYILCYYIEMIRGHFERRIGEELGRLPEGKFEHTDTFGSHGSVDVIVIDGENSEEEMAGRDQIIVHHTTKPTPPTDDVKGILVDMLGGVKTTDNLVSATFDHGKIDQIASSKTTDIHEGMLNIAKSERRPISGIPSKLSILKLATVARDLKKARKVVEKAQKSQNS